jgi:hypothetical protein
MAELEDSFLAEPFRGGFTEYLRTRSWDMSRGRPRGRLLDLVGADLEVLSYSSNTKD